MPRVRRECEEKSTGSGRPAGFLPPLRGTRMSLIAMRRGATDGRGVPVDFSGRVSTVTAGNKVFLGYIDCVNQVSQAVAQTVISRQLWTCT